MLTAKQQRIYLYIRDYVTKHGLAPTQREIAQQHGISSRGLVQRYINALVKADLLRTIPGRKRNLVLNKESALPFSRLPVIGRISAGQPIDEIEDQQVLDLAGTLLGPNRFVLEVSGDSMIGDNICDGDYIICERCDEVEDGDIVVAVIDGRDTTLKRFHPLTDGQVMLTPSNPELKPCVYAHDRISFKGVYLGLIRLSESGDEVTTILPEQQLTV